MDNIASNNMQPVVRKAKKKQVKDELDRLKQAEKKKRRLEKALATSAAICSELEKKKQKKKEEQQRLDEEGAAIAEAVALRVLLGEDNDDPCEVFVQDDPCEVVLNKDDELNLNFNISFNNPLNCSFQGIGWVSDARHGSGCDWGNTNSDWSYYSRSYASNLGEAGFSAGLMAAQAVSSLHIADDECADTMEF